MSILNALSAGETFVYIEGEMAEQLIAHLKAEQSTLAAMLNAVRQVHEALRKFDEEALEKSLEDEARQLACSIDLQKRRCQLQDSIADEFQLPSKDVTVRRLTSMTHGAVRDSIERIWNSLSQMAKEVEQLNHQNAAMINQSISIARGIVERLTGVSGVGESYNAGGARSESHVGPLIQWGA